MLENEETTIDQEPIKPSEKCRPDLSASLVIHQGDKKIWRDYFSVWHVQEGYFKGKDNDGKTIIVQTCAAKNAVTGQQDTPSNKRRPDLFIYIEAEENGETFWDEILVAWKSKNGNFLTKNAEGQDIVIQTRETKDASFKQRQKKRSAPVDLSAFNIGYTLDGEPPQDTAELADT